MNSPIGKNEGDPSPTPEAPVASTAAADEKRAAARRRFLKMSAGGSAAMVVTITHRRAYAGAKKGWVASVCASVVGTPDIKGLDSKKAIEVSSVGGGYKNVVCPVEKPGKCSPTPDKQASHFFARYEGTELPAVPGETMPNVVFPNYAHEKSVPPVGTAPGYTKVRYWEAGVKDGCGDYETTLDKSYAYRLYEKGYCPVVIDPGTGRLKYDVQKYYEEKGCDPNKETCFVNNKGENKKFIEHTCTPTDSPP